MQKWLKFVLIQLMFNLSVLSLMFLWLEYPRVHLSDIHVESFTQRDMLFVAVPAGLLLLGLWGFCRACTWGISRWSPPIEAVGSVGSTGCPVSAHHLMSLESLLQGQMCHSIASRTPANEILNWMLISGVVLLTALETITGRTPWFSLKVIAGWFVIVVILRLWIRRSLASFSEVGQHIVWTLDETSIQRASKLNQVVCSWRAFLRGAVCPEGILLYTSDWTCAFIPRYAFLTTEDFAAAARLVVANLRHIDLR